MAVDKKKENEFNNLLSEENHLTVIKAASVNNSYKQWMEDKITIEEFKKRLDNI